jgi:hypothetical protein
MQKKSKKHLSYSPTRGHDFSRVPMQVAKQETVEGDSDPESKTFRLKKKGLDICLLKQLNLLD